MSDGAADASRLLLLCILSLKANAYQHEEADSIRPYLPQGRDRSAQARKMTALLSVVLASAFQAYDLRVNALTEPLALQGLQPSLSWKLRSNDPTAKDQAQGAYRVLVASTPALLKKEVGDLWDTGKVASSDQYGIRYQGKPLHAKQFAYWKVQVWDLQGGTSGWSNATLFGTGIQTPADYRAGWIHGAKPIAPANPLAAAKWIWAMDESGNTTPVATHLVTTRFEAKAGDSVRFVGTADDRMTMRLNGKVVLQTSGTDAWKRVQSVDLTTQVKPGLNELEFEVTNAQISPAGFIGVVSVGSKTITSGADWLVNGKTAKVIGENGVQPWGQMRENALVTAPAQYFSKSVSVTKKVARATLYASALGIADFTLNGKRISEDLFSPGWTDYRKRVPYRAFDITRQLKPNANELGAVLGQGWYAGYIAWDYQREHYGDTPMLWMMAEIEYEDGTVESIGTDTTWRVGEGPIRDEHFLHGEKFDARVDISHKTTAAKIGKPIIGKLEALNCDPVREYQRLKAKSVKAVKPGKYLIDFGQNLTGFVHLKVNYPKGTTITIRHGERLDAEGKLYTENLRLAQAIDTYTCAGTKDEWSPRFTFHGFQYIEVSGLPAAPSKDTFQAVAISSATPETGTLKTSDALLNKLIRNAWWTQKMNFVDVPTDCPQRDERLGWTGDAQAYISTASYYSDVQAFFAKWLVSLDDAQRADGQYPMVAPILHKNEFFGDGGPAWADAGVICPMTIYQVYGDKELLARHYPQMKKFIAFCKGRSKPNLLPPDKYHAFGDWLSIKADTPNDIITTAYFAGSAKIVSDVAKILGKDAESSEYQKLYLDVRKAFQDAYVDADGNVKGETQCGYVLALGFDLLDLERAEKAASHLVKNIEERGWHLSTGFVGTRDLMHVLSKIKRNDVAFRLLHNTTFPSWGFTVVNGATSIWERWDGWTPENGFQDRGMNSFAHYAYGAVVGWMFKTVGGVSELEPGYQRVLIAPAIDPELTWAECKYESVRGTISTRWEIRDEQLLLRVEIPPNMNAVIRVPKRKGGASEIHTGSGVHEFTEEWKATTQ
jgi:alpha-L-rhamnosidase